MTQQATNQKTGGAVDRCGAFASTICAVHCLACALLPATLAALGLDFLIGHETEWLLTIIAVLFGITAFILSWRSHRNTLILLALSMGIVGLLSARILEGAAHHDHHGSEAHENHDEAEKDHTADNKKDAKLTKEHHGSDKEHHGSDKEHHGSDKEHHGSDKEHDGHDEHGEGHMAIEALSVSAGVLLVIGHLSNLVVLRRRKKDEDSSGCAAT